MTDSTPKASSVPPVPIAQPGGVPPAEVQINQELVEKLVQDQHPDLVGLPVAHVATGWDNTTFRLGEELAVRLPRISAATELLLKEQRWLPLLAPGIPVDIPVPVRTGLPGPDFPWPWSIVPWAPGRSAEHENLDPSEAARFGRVLAAIHRPAPEDAPRNDYRGIPLSQVAPRVETRIEALSQLPDQLPAPVDRLSRIWKAALAGERDVEETWIHGDLHPKNLVVRDGRLVSVLDWGDMTVGDPATDLASAWMLFSPGVHGQIWAAYGAVSAPTLARARGWAIFFGVNLVDSGLAGDAAFGRIGRSTLGRLLGQD